MEIYLYGFELLDAECMVGEHRKRTALICCFALDRAINLQDEKLYR